MFGFGKGKKVKKMDKTDYENPVYQKGLKYLSTMSKEDLKANKNYALTLGCTMNEGMDSFFEMIRAMDDKEYTQWIEETLH